MAESNAHHVEHDEHHNGHNGHDSAAVISDAGQVLLEKIRSRQAIVGVIGLGYVGLPLALGFAEAGFRVVGIDVDGRKVDKLNVGESYIEDVPAERLTRLMDPLRAVCGAALLPIAATVGDDRRIQGNGAALADAEERPADATPGSFCATTNYDVLLDVDAVVMCVPTPLNHTKEPDLSYIISATDQVARRLHRGMLIVLESTTYPGTTEELVLPRLQQPAADGSRFAVGNDFFLGFSPERIDPGRKDWTVRNTPKVIAGVTPVCRQVIQALYETAIERIVPVSLPRTAEMVKLLENTFRAVNIALMNEIAIMCDRLGIDVWEVIEAAKTKPYGYMAFYPGPGVGGHCIPLDPQYLAWKLRALNYNARFIQLAEEINLSMPHYVVTKTADALNDIGKPLKGSHILVMGVAYKANIGDMRESPVLDVMHLLRQKGADVVYNDPYVPTMRLGHEQMTSIPLDDAALQAADCVIIGTAHACYDWTWVAKNSHLIVDTRNALWDVHTNGTRVVKL